MPTLRFFSGYHYVVNILLEDWDINIVLFFLSFFHMMRGLWPES